LRGSDGNYAHNDAVCACDQPPLPEFPSHQNGGNNGENTGNVIQSKHNVLPVVSLTAQVSIHTWPVVQLSCRSQLAVGGVVAAVEERGILDFRIAVTGNLFFVPTYVPRQHPDGPACDRPGFLCESLIRIAGLSPMWIPIHQQEMDQVKSLEGRTK